MTEEAPTVALDVEWLGAQLADDGFVPQVRFAGFIGTGQMSRNARFELDWGEGHGPASVVVKLPSDDAGTRAVSFEHGIYSKECEFYRAIAERVDVTVPGVHVVHIDVEAHDFAVVLEDLRDSEQGDQFSQPSAERVMLAIEQAAALHAPVWNAVDDPVFDFLREDTEARAAAAGDAIPAFLPTVFERLGDALEPDVGPALRRFAELAGDWARLRSVPTTLVHGDFRPDNMLFGLDTAAPPIAIVDWQTLGLGMGVTDVAYFVGAALEPSHRREVEDELIAAYRTELAERGVDYPLERCRYEYALGSLHGLAIAVTATTMATRTERGDALFTLMLNRHARHALDLGALDLVADQL